MSDAVKRPQEMAAPPAKLDPPPAAAGSELSDEELGKVSGGIALDNDPRMPVVKSVIIPKLDATLP